MANIYNLTDTWNDAGTPFFAISMDVTNTASAAGSMIQRWGVNGSTVASLSPVGLLTLVSPNDSGISFEIACTENRFQLRGYDPWGMLVGKNNAGALVFCSNDTGAPILINHGYGSGQIVWSGTYTGPAGAGIGFVGTSNLKITDGASGYGQLDMLRSKRIPVLVSALPDAAAAGMMGTDAFVSNALTPVFGSAVVGGGAVGVPVYSDGTSWIVG